MKFTLSWLFEHLDTDADLAGISETLTRIGLEVEQIVDPGEALKSFVVAEVEHAELHPDADKLKIARVNDGQNVHQVVCGAPNCVTGMMGVFAPPGAYIPGSDFTLKKAKIRGVESSGMLCSERELEISDEHDGIIVLPAGAKAGSPAAAALGLTDPMIEIAITPNRPDCTGVRGIARDLAAAGLGRLKPDPVNPVKSNAACPQTIALNFPKEHANACPVFAGRVIEGVSNGTSPAWMQKRLKAIGLRPINALVDITNYITFDRARPLHVYDADRLQGDIQARLGKNGETLEALDGKTYTLDDEMVVIADDTGVLGLGGVIGGQSTGCTEKTTRVFIESAYFDPIRTAMTGRKLQLMSDARFRFERGIDPHSVDLGLDYATQLILEICGGTASQSTLAGAVPDTTNIIRFSVADVARLTGLTLKPEDVTGALEKLGFKIEGSEADYHVDVPGWRPDIQGAADLVEEVMRLHGVDHVPTVPLPRLSGVARPVLTDGQKRVRRARRVLAGRGLIEAVTWSFIPKDQALFLGGGTPQLDLANPISTEMSAMRPSLLPGLLSALQRNVDRGLGEPAIFEVGQAYASAEPDGQFVAASGVRYLSAKPMGAGRFWNGAAAPVDVYDVKADVLAVLSALGVNPVSAQVAKEAPGWFHPGRSGAVKLGPKRTLCYFGELHPLLLEKFGVSGPAAGFEIFLDQIPAPKRKPTRTRAALNITDLQPLRRDFAFVVDRDIAAGDLLRAARGAEKALIEKVILFDVFEGGSLGAGKKSLAIEITLQPRDRTLTDEEIEAVANKVVKAVGKSTGAVLRG